jgi:hypothetical protein
MKLDLVLNAEERKERFKVFHAMKKIDQNPPAVVASSQTYTGKYNWNSGASVTSNGMQRSPYDNYCHSLVSPPMSDLFARQNWTITLPSSRSFPVTSRLEHITQEPQRMMQSSMSPQYQNLPALQPLNNHLPQLHQDLNQHTNCYPNTEISFSRNVISDGFIETARENIADQDVYYIKAGIILRYLCRNEGLHHIKAPLLQIIKNVHCIRKTKV